jgi:prepilin-type N-terminal cleavage/methylation domain-containing protein
LRLGADNGERRRRAGFTLVEVIVVLVILAILAAIAIPALTGYIDKAEDKKYIADARNHFLAVRTIMDEKYAEDQYNTTGAQDYIANGMSDSSVGAPRTSNIWNPNNSNFGADVWEKASALIGERFATNDEPGHWEIWLYGELNDSSTTALNAEAYLYIFYPEGMGTGNKPQVIVTYKLNVAADIQNGKVQSLNNTFKGTKLTYNPDAGYKVYHLLGL